MTTSWKEVFKFIELESTDSTNLEAHRIISTNVSEPHVIIAESQTAGRGRYGRQWNSPKGNLYFSVLFPYNFDKTPDPAHYTFISAISILNGVAGVLPVNGDLKLKWPNDLLLNGKKVGGILLEFLPTISYNEQSWIIIGIGVNLVSCPENLHYPATSLKESSGITVTPHELLNQFMIQFVKNEELNSLLGFEVIRKEWLKHAWGLGEEISSGLEEQSIRGQFIGLNPDGACIIKTSTGIKNITSGEVFFKNNK